MDTQSLVVKKAGKKLLKSTQLFIIAGTVLMTMVITIMCIGFTVKYEVTTDTADTESVAYWKEHLPPEQSIWFDKGAEELRLATKKKKPQSEVKNVVLFVAQGVSSEMLAKARFRNMESATDFIWDTFPYVGVLRTLCGFSSFCDLATLGTSFFGGVKTRTGLQGLDERVTQQNCLQANNKTFQINSIFEHAQNLKLRTGFITTERITGPLISSLYAHTADTKWECDAAIPPELKSDCLDVATQLTLGSTGQAINVIMGGGKQTLVSRLSNDSAVDSMTCDSKDKRNLLQDWKYLKLEKNEKSKLLESARELEKFNGTKRDFVLGVFSNTNLHEERPNLRMMLMKSLDVLMRNSGGYLAVVETAVAGEDIENSQRSLVELEDVIKATLDHKGFSPQSTLMLVTFMNFPKSTTTTSTENTIPEDIRVYATGPNAHLFHRVHDETYLAHAISYSLKMGPFAVKKKNKKA